MKKLPGTTVPSASRGTRAASTSLLAIAFFTLTGCATVSPGAAPVPSDAASVAPSAAVTATPSVTPTPEPTPTPTAVDVTEAPFNGEILIITSEVRDGVLEVSAMIPDVSESGGTCTLALAAGDASVSTEASEGKDVTYCGLMSIPLDGADPTFTVTYSSSTTRAESAVTTVEPAA